MSPLHQVELQRHGFRRAVLVGPAGAALCGTAALSVPARPSVSQHAGRPRGSLELHELKEAFDRTANTWPTWRTFAIPEMTDSVITEPMAALEQAIKASNSARFAAVYEQSTVACNTYYRSA